MQLALLLFRLLLNYVLWMLSEDAPKMLHFKQKCSVTLVVGVVFLRNFCKSCKGEKVTKGTKSVKLDIMAGIDNNETIKVYRSGGADPDRDNPGDLYVTIKFREDPVIRREGSDILVEVVLSINQTFVELCFMDAVRGCTKNVTFQTEVLRNTCGGSGVPPGTRPETCSHSKGSRVNFCKSCKGEKVTKGTKSVKLDIMAGIDNNETIKVYRSGGADPDRDNPGDLYVTIKFREDPVIRREGSDILVEVVLSINQVCPGTQPGHKVVLKKKGTCSMDFQVFSLR